MIKKVSIITINYNGLKDTVEMIESLAIHETYPHEIIVVDNASTDPLEHKLLQSKFPAYRLYGVRKTLDSPVVITWEYHMPQAIIYYFLTMIQSLPNHS